MNNRFLDINSRRCILQAASISFDAATFEVWGALLNGARCVLYPERIPTVAKLEEIINDQRIDILFLTTALFNLLSDERPDLIRQVKNILMGGEIISVEHVKRVYEQSAGMLITHVYGPTENTTFTSYYHIPMDKVKTFPTIPIGKPISNTSTYVFDREWLSVPVGVIGELYLSGDGLARQYWKQPALSAEKFIPHPFSQKGGERLYKTGDLVRYLPNGLIEFVGRFDDQVKIRGFRIELGEIESVLIQHEHVREVVVQALSYGEENSNHYLVAYVVGSDKLAQDDQHDLRSVLQIQLPDYMIPSYFVYIDELPLTLNGKINYKALPTPSSETLFENEYIAPRSDNEKIIVAIWSDVLKLSLDKISIDANFFDLGGQSLFAVNVTSRLRKIHGWDVSLKSIFEYPTVESLAVFLDNGANVEIDSTPINLRKEAVLESTIDVANAEYPCVDVPHDILLTGATGFIGRFLLCELLEQTSVHVTCLVRGENNKNAFKRLKKVLLLNKLWQPDYASRLGVIAGDLAQPRLGLSESDFAELAQQIDVIYHNATAMNHIASYAVLKSATVGGTQEILRLACTYRLKPVHFSSTLNIFSQDHHQLEKNRVVDELTSINDEKHLISDGYAASKWVSEKLIMLAQERGIPCFIYRFGLVVGDTKMGRYDTDQWLYRLLRSCIHSGRYPDDFGSIGLLPVDIAVKALVLLAQKRHYDNDCNTPLQQTVFHLVSSELVEISQFFKVYNQIYFDAAPLIKVSFKQWLQEIKEFIERGDDRGEINDIDRNVSIYPLMLESKKSSQNVSENDYKTVQTKTTLIQSNITQKLLRKNSIHFSKIDLSLMGKYLRFIVRSMQTEDKSL